MSCGPGAFSKKDFSPSFSMLYFKYYSLTLIPRHLRLRFTSSSGLISFLLSDPILEPNSVNLARLITFLLFCFVLMTNLHPPSRLISPFIHPFVPLDSPCGMPRHSSSPPAVSSPICHNTAPHFSLVSLGMYCTNSVDTFVQIPPPSSGFRRILSMNLADSFPRWRLM